MPDHTHTLVLILTMSVVTILLRLLPFAILHSTEATPRYLVYLGTVLPCAIMGMLIVYCLRNVSFLQLSSAAPAVIAVGLTALLQYWKHSTLISIVGGTACYMVLVQLVFA